MDQRPGSYAADDVRPVHQRSSPFALEIDTTLPITDVRTLDEQIERRFTQERLFAQLSSCFGGLALALACVGLYGLMSYSVLSRTGEIGIRLALGALPRRILGMILR